MSEQKRRYTVVGAVTISVHTVVHAASEEEAREIAGERPNGSSGKADCGEEREAWIGEELDGEVTIVHVYHD